MTEQIGKKFATSFGREPEVITFAPGRFEFIGNHTDYNGGTVLGASVDRGVWVAVARRPDGHRGLMSDAQGPRIVHIPDGPPSRRNGDDAWVNYPLGVLAVLPFFGFQRPAGFDYLAVSNLPLGSGLSSSAAIELASALAFLALTGQICSPEVLAQIGRKAENEFVGVPCGILDQGVSAFGRAHHLVHIDCRKLGFSHVRLPQEVNFWVFNTHTRHALVEGLYAERHRECMEAAAILGVHQLADATPAQLDTVKGSLPASTAMRARHVIEEISRVRETVVALASGQIRSVGRLLTASHRSSQTLFENSSPELDLLVNQLVETAHVYGARLTGGGFGGAVLALTSSQFGAEQANTVANHYAQRFGIAPEILPLSSGGGAAVIFSKDPLPNPPQS